MVPTYIDLLGQNHIYLKNYQSCNRDDYLQNSQANSDEHQIKTSFWLPLQQPVLSDDPDSDGDIMLHHRQPQPFSARTNHQSNSHNYHRVVFYKPAINTQSNYQHSSEHCQLPQSSSSTQSSPLHPNNYYNHYGESRHCYQRNVGGGASTSSINNSNNAVTLLQTSSQPHYNRGYQHNFHHWSGRGSIGSSSSGSDSESSFNDTGWTQVIGPQAHGLLGCGPQTHTLIGCGPSLPNSASGCPAQGPGMINCAPTMMACGSQVGLMGRYGTMTNTGFGMGASLVCVATRNSGQGNLAMMTRQCGMGVGMNYTPQYWVTHGTGPPRCWNRWGWGCGQWLGGREDGCCLVGLCAASNRLAHLFRGLFNS